MFETHPRGGTSMGITRATSENVHLFLHNLKIFQLFSLFRKSIRAEIRLHSNIYTDAVLVEVVVVVVAEVTATC